jgi:4-amino-4-deoxy-L-arabinose transferase-like glycosyltransferase
VIFGLAGLAFVPRLGVENDEALFAAAIYDPHSLPAVHIGHSTFPLMLMSYLGTLKAWIYRPIFGVFGTGMPALRDPMVLAGVLSIWLFFLLLRRAAGNRAALFGCVLLAADSIYLLTATFDWGPVALEHLLLVAGLFLLLRFYQEGQERDLALGFFVWGLALWDKALAIWLLTGFGIAGIAVFPRQIWRVTGARRVAVSALAFVLGAAPLIVYNAKNHLATFRGNFHYDTSDLPHKVLILENTATGYGMFGWLIDEDYQTKAPHEAKGVLETASARISAVAGHPRHNLMLYAFALALLLTPLARGDALRAILFALIALTVAWIQMAIGGPEVGGSLHHTILLWPLPAMAIALSLAAASRRLGRAGIPALAVILTLLAGSGALVTNEYFAETVRNGGAPFWTDAIFGLSGYVKRLPAKTLYCEDWGILDNLRLLGRGKLPLRSGMDPLANAAMTPPDREDVLRMISDPGGVFLAHTREFAVFPANEKLLDFAAGAGYRREVLATISDSYGRPAYEVYRFAAPAGSKPTQAGMPVPLLQTGAQDHNP